MILRGGVPSRTTVREPEVVPFNDYFLSDACRCLPLKVAPQVPVVPRFLSGASRCLSYNSERQGLTCCVTCLHRPPLASAGVPLVRRKGQRWSGVSGLFDPAKGLADPERTRQIPPWDLPTEPPGRHGAQHLAMALRRSPSSPSGGKGIRDRTRSHRATRLSTRVHHLHASCVTSAAMSDASLPLKGLRSHTPEACYSVSAGGGRGVEAAHQCGGKTGGCDF